MDLSTISRHGRGLIPPNNTVVWDQNSDDEYAFDLSNRAELKSRSHDKRKDARVKSAKKKNKKNTCVEWGGGDKLETMHKDEEENTGEDKNGIWYAFLNDLYNKFSEYVIQKDRQKYNVARLDNWGQTGQRQGISVTTKTFKKFLNKIKNFNVAEYQNIKNLKITDSKIEKLNKVLDLTLNHTVTIKCSESYIIVRDNFISLNETIQNLVSNSSTDKKCNDFEDQFKKGKYNLLKIFALNKVFIDTDLKFSGKEISVAIIAPKWEVIGSRSIELSGAHAEPYIEAKAKNGAHPGNNGTDGSPGKPGVSGESFFGIGVTFVGGENLKINSVGGKGGLGQNGGDGAPGMPGKDADRPRFNDDDCKNGHFKVFKCELLEKGDPYYPPGGMGHTSINKVKIHGLPGGKGGNGGRGGKGGKGGKGGNIQIIDFGHPSKITVHSAEGKEGEIGKGGIGGPGVKNGDDIIASVFLMTTYPCFGGCSASASWTYKDTVHTGMSSAGNNGTDGESTTGLKDPIPAKGISRLPNIINEYKIFLRANLKSHFQESSLRNFLDLLDKTNDIRRLYDILALSGEFQDLEERFFNLRKHMDVSPFYRSLLERIKAFAERQEDIRSSKENKKVLNYLYTAVLGRIFGLKEASEQNLIIDMRHYLAKVLDDIQILKNLRNTNNKVKIINRYKKKYKDDMEEKIDEAKTLIEKQISPEIKNVSSKIDEQVLALIKKTIEMQKQAEKDWETLAEKKRALKSAMALKGLFNLFKIIGGVVSFLGPVGTIAGTVITGATTVGETLALSGKEKILSLPDPVTKDLKKLKDQIEAMRKRKTDYLDKLVKNLKTEIEKNPDTLGDMTSKVDEIKGKLERVTKKELDFKVVSGLERDLEENIRTKGVDLTKYSSDKKHIDAVKAIDKLNQTIQFGSLFLKMHGEMEKDKEQMDTITSSMEEMQDKMKMLREYEKNIYDTIAPMLQEMEENMEDISDKLGTKSHVALDVTKWQVQSTLKNIKFQMEKLTKSHDDIKDEIKHSIENLEDVMTTMINVYDRIQNYQDQQNLANYIADISSVAASDINIKNQDLVKVVNDLEFAIRANIVMEQYKKAMDGFKQFVFPFACRFIKEDMLPENLQLEKNIDNLVQKAMKQIEMIVGKLRVYDSVIVDGDQSLVCEEFSSRFVSTEPFFVWKNEEYKRSISKLLSGEKVILKAKIENSDREKDAIKFSEISFDWKVKNETSQSQLNQILKGFDIKAYHLGNSYYRYHDKISLITSKKLKLKFSYEKYGDGMPIRANKVYYRLKSGDLMLSPYTLWKIRLIQKTKKYSFKDLEAFKNESNLELSGLGSYIDISEMKGRKKKKRPKRESFYRGLKECKRSVYSRSARSVNRITVSSGYATNDASKVMSSPVSFFCNFLKTYFISNIARLIYPTFYGEKTSVKKECSEFLDGGMEMKNIGPTVVLNPNMKDTGVSSAKCDFIKEGSEKKSDFSFDSNFNDNNRFLNPLLLSDQKDRSNYHSTQFSDLNCSLLLADLVTRTITGKRYESSVSEYLLSKKEIMLGKIFGGVIRNESEIKQMLQRYLAEKEVERASSSFSKLHSYTKQVFRFFGFVGNSDTEEYVQDIRRLFA